MKRGELVILWIGGLLSLAVLIIERAPLRALPGIDINYAGYVFKSSLDFSQFGSSAHLSG